MQGVCGIVDEVHLAYTILRDEDDVRIMIPNKHIVGEILHNSGVNSLVETSITVDYSADPDQVIGIIRSVLEANDVAMDQAPQVGIDDFTENGLSIGARFWVPTQKFHQTRFKVNNGIYAAVKQAGVKLAVPRRDIQLQGQSD